MLFDRVNAWWIGILAPPGYAKITSTPSRSRLATRISAPFIVSPRSGPGWSLAVLDVAVVFIKTSAGLYGRQGAMTSSDRPLAVQEGIAAKSTKRKAGTGLSAGKAPLASRLAKHHSG